jgi:hypothetical protein
MSQCEISMFGAVRCGGEATITLQLQCAADVTHISTEGCCASCAVLVRDLLSKNQADCLACRRKGRVSPMREMEQRGSLLITRAMPPA